MSSSTDKLQTMPNNNAILVQSLTKVYRLFDRHVDRIKETFHPLRRLYHRDFTALDKVYVPFTVSNVAQAAAIASLDAADELLARTDALVDERVRVSAELRDAGFTLPPSQANFVWLPLGPRTPDFLERAADARIVVRPYGTDGVRVTVGAPEENDALLRFARSWNANHRSTR